MRYLRTNTATRITVGPFQDKTDGVTPETGLTVTSCKLTFMVDTGGVPTLIIDAAATASGGDNDMVHVTNDDAGFYDLELTAAQTNYLGRAMLAITDAATHCPVFHEFMILPANVYDAMVLGTDVLQADVTEIGGVAQSATDLKHFADSGYDPATSKVQGVVLVDTTTTNTDMRGTNSAALASVCTEARLAELDAANLPTDVAAVKTDTAAILLDTGTDGVVTKLIDQDYIETGTAQSGTANTIVLAAGAASTDDLWVGQQVSIYDGTGAGQTRGVLNYNGTTKALTVARNWKVNPNATSKYKIQLWFGPKVNNTLEVSVADAGADLTAIPWNSAWDTEVQSECADALTAYAPATPAQVLTQVDAALDAAGTELTAIPTTTGTVRQKLNFLFQYFRNKKTITSTTETLKKEDASTTLGTATVSDDGSVFTKGEMS